MTSILGVRFNNLQSRISTIYGPAVSAVSTSGYGQTIRSRQITPYAVDPKSFNAATAVNYSTDQITIPSHNFANGDFARYDNNGNSPLIAPLQPDAHFFVKVIDANTIELHFAENLNNKVNLITGATGTHILNKIKNEPIAAADVFNLYLDIAAARIHQVGSSFTIANNARVLTGDSIIESYINTLESTMTSVEADRFLIADPGQVSEEVLRDSLNNPVFSQRTTAWNGTIAHEFTVNFPSVAQQRGYWNAAGEIIFSPSLTGGSGLKTNDWRNLLTSIGIITFDRTGPSVTGSATLGSVTPYTLTTSHQILVRKFSSNYTYADNRFTLYGRRNNDTQLQFRVEFADLNAPGGFRIDENVNGTIRSDVDIYRPTGTFVVNGTTYTTVTFSLTGQTTTNL